MTGYVPPNIEAPKPMYTTESFLQAHPSVQGNYDPKGQYEGRGSNINAVKPVNRINPMEGLYGSKIDSKSLVNQKLDPLKGLLLNYSLN